MEAQATRTQRSRRVRWLTAALAGGGLAVVVAVPAIARWSGVDDGTPPAPVLVERTDARGGVAGQGVPGGDRADSGGVDGQDGGGRTDG